MFLPDAFQRSSRHPFAIRGSILLPLALVILLLAASAALIVPRAQAAQRRSRAIATITDLRQFAAAFQHYAHEKGDWPETSTAPGAVPAGMEKTLDVSRWQKTTPIGGRYVFLTNTRLRGQRLRAALSIVSVGEDRVSADARQLETLVQLAREAGFPPNRLRLGFRQEPFYVMEH
ncbi:hypothetical protein [Opitutus sp. ER46]|uniref:hypothetical protein n=1 Tax=Opitutus sp. ER46 TaxID=2161864 RepID=UPI000D2FCAAA|nr:hypothetical protein [Opitutus sp. ER46]PTY00320.1 hypothetical protein DB354_01530 [Opitutus sp. ER46]